MAPAPTTFAEKYGQQEPVPGASFYEGTYNYDTLGPAELFNQMTQYIGNADSAIGVLWVRASDFETRVHYVHNLFRFTPTIGKPTQWDNRCFGIMEDVSFGGRYGSIPVEVTKNVFSKASPKVRVPKLDHFYDALTTTLANSPEAFALEPIDNADENSEEIAPRVGLLVPPQLLAKCVIAQGGMKAFDFWDAICRPLMDTEQDRKDYKHVLDFGRALCVRTSDDKCVLYNNMDNGGVRFIIPDQAILQRTQETTDRMLPVTNVPQPPPPPLAGTTAMAPATTTGTGTADATAALITALQQHQKDSADQKKKVSTKLPGTYQVLQRVLQTEDEDSFPPFWKDFANADKASRPGVLTNALQQAVIDIGGNLAIPPAATAHLVESLTLGRFASHDQDNLTAGMTVFTIVTTSTGISQSHEDISVYAATYGGNALPTTADLRRLAKSPAVFPTTTLQTVTQLGGYLALIHVSMGKNHPFTTAFRNFYESMRPEIERAESYLHSQAGGVAPIAARLFMKIHIITNRFLHKLSITPLGEEGPMLPPYTDIVNQMVYRSFFQFPSLPPQYITKTPPIDNRATQELPPSGGDKVPKAKKDAATRSETVRNKDHLSAALVSRYCQFIASERGQPVKELVMKPGITKPLADNLPNKRENQLCLNYHLTESCHDLCPRKKTHRSLTTTEEQKVGQFLTDANVP